MWGGVGEQVSRSGEHSFAKREGLGALPSDAPVPLT